MRKPRNNNPEFTERLQIDYAMEGESSREHHYMLFYNKPDLEKALEWLINLALANIMAKGVTVGGTKAWKVTMTEYQREKFKTWASDNGIVVRFFSRITATDEDSFVMKKARIPRGPHE